MGECGPHAGFDAFKVWMLAQLLWEPERPLAELQDDFFSGWYGPAAPAMRRFFARCEAQWMAQQGPPWWIKFYQQQARCCCSRRRCAPSCGRSSLKRWKSGEAKGERRAGREADGGRQTTEGGSRNYTHRVHRGTEDGALRTNVVQVTRWQVAGMAEDGRRRTEC
jgi:hypothetical protein